MYCIIFLLLDGDIMKTATRSGHRIEDLNNVLHYILQCKRVQIDSGKLVSNWESLKDPCLPPSSWHFITRANKELVYALLRHLFNNRWNIFDSHLQEFCLTMFATVLRTLPERIKEFGENTLINVILQKAFRKFKIDKETVNEWIKAVKKGWNDDNVSSLTTNVVLHKEVKELRSEIRELKQEAVKSYELQCEILKLLKNLNIGTVRSNSDGCPDISVNGASDSGVYVQVNNDIDLGVEADSDDGVNITRDNKSSISQSLGK
jgi:transposase-like protein